MPRSLDIIKDYPNFGNQTIFPNQLKGFKGGLGMAKTDDAPRWYPKKKVAGPFSKIPAAYKLKFQFVQARD